MSNKQSSVELFAISLYEKGFLQGNGDEINNLLEQAKAMHNEELFQTFKAGQDSTEEGGKGFEQWYNLTYGGNK